MKTAEKKKIAKFIIDNSLEFQPGRRNADSVVLSGFVLSLGIESTKGLKKLINENCESYDFKDELNRVFEYAKDHDYGHWWRTAEAKSQYKF